MMKFEIIAKLFISFVLLIIYFILFGVDSIHRLWEEDITITRNEEFPENITSPGKFTSNNNRQSLSPYTLLSYYLTWHTVTVAVTVEMISEHFGQLNCNNKNFTLEEFKACISNSNIALNSDKIDFDIDENSFYQIINPKEGSIQFAESDTLKLQLKPSNTYFVTFYDRNFMIRSNNPEVVPKNGITIKPRAYAYIYIKVNIQLRFYQFKSIYRFH